jgi:hypothetical protein
MGAGLVFCDRRIFDVSHIVDRRNTFAELGHEVLLVDLYLLYSSLNAVNQALDSVQQAEAISKLGRSLKQPGEKRRFAWGWAERRSLIENSIESIDERFPHQVTPATGSVTATGLISSAL